jgi:hypothetical protein
VVAAEPDGEGGQWPLVGHHGGEGADVAGCGVEFGAAGQDLVQPGLVAGIQVIGMGHDPAGDAPGLGRYRGRHLALFAEMERTFANERAARAVAEARPVARPADKIEYARLLKAGGASLGQIAAKTVSPPLSGHPRPR